MPANQLFSDWVAGETLTVAKLNQMKNDLAALAGANFTGAIQVNSNTVWHAGNDGAGSGLDADSVDGYSAAALMQSFVQEYDDNHELDLITNRGGYLVFTDEAVVTLPDGATSGWACRIRHAAGANTVQLTPGSGVSIVGGQQVQAGGVVWLIANGSDTWYVDGSTEGLSIAPAAASVTLAGLTPTVSVA